MALHAARAGSKNSDIEKMLSVRLNFPDRVLFAPMTIHGAKICQVVVSGSRRSSRTDEWHVLVLR